jgi:hypothetical protein
VESVSIEGDLLPTISNDKRTGRDEKMIHAKTYISNYVESSITDTSPKENQQDTKYLPFKKLRHFFAEYVYECEVNNIPKYQRAGETTFVKAYHLVKKEKHCKLSSGKGNTHSYIMLLILNCFHNLCFFVGSFEICEVCNSADELLNQCSQNGWTIREKDVLLHYRRLHLKK